MFRNLSIIFLLTTAPFVSSCDQKKDVTETNSYNAYFIYPEVDDAKKVYVGTVTGLSSCKYIVGDYYNKRRKFLKGTDWDYICCLRTKENNCVEEHRYGDD